MVCTVNSVYYSLSSLRPAFDSISWPAVSTEASLQKRNGTNQPFVLFTGERFVCVCMHVEEVTGRELSDFSRAEITVDRRTVKPQSRLNTKLQQDFCFPGLGYKPLTGQ